ncbi:MAG: RpoL/Rpb11 RNA polymerase subunit family protein [Nitrososphaera sp.]|jgi:DNA-directed RNA polymerase subunit L
MLAEITDFKDNEIEIKVREEDISVFYIVQHELLKEKSVDFAGVMLQHPLTKDFKMRVATKRKDPMEVIQDASAAATDYAKELSGMIKAALK